MHKSFRKGTSCLLAALLMAGTPMSILAQSSPAPAQNDASDDGSQETTKMASFVDGFMPMTILSELKDDVWGVPLVGKRDQDNGLEDRTLANYCYWDGTILKGTDAETGKDKYYMFASRWDQANGHSGWGGSVAVYATSDNLEGPYTDQGMLWPDYYEGAGHNVFAFEISKTDPAYKEGYRYAISVSDTGLHGDQMNGSIHISKSLDGPWEHVGIMETDGKFRLSNVTITQRPDGTYLATGRDGDIATAASVRGPWTTQRQKLWWDIPGMNTSALEDPVLWYSDGMYHIVVNNWQEKYAYYLTSYDGVQDWTLHTGTAYSAETMAQHLQYTDGTKNSWTKLERPGVYIEDGTLKAMTLAVIDSEKDDDRGNDEHGSKVIVIPYNGKALAEFAKTDEYTPASTNRKGLAAQSDTHIQSWGEEAGKNYGSEAFLQVQGNASQGLLGEGERPNSDYDCKIAFVRYALDQNTLPSDLSRIDADLSIIYQSRHAGSATEEVLQAAVADSNWGAGDGTDNGGGSTSVENAVTWYNQPAVDQDLGKAESETFSVDDTDTEVRIPVGTLIQKYLEKNPDVTEITFAIATKNGTRLHIGSNESSNDQGVKLVFASTPETPEVTGIALDKDELDLHPGDTYSLQVTITPENATNKKVTFTSSNPAAATVDENGKITAVAKGGTTIRAVTEDGGLMAKCGVRVTPVGATIIGLDSVTVYTPSGFDARLPQTVSANWSDDTTTEETVVWDTEGKSLSSNGTLEGTVNGTAIKASCKIETVSPLLSWVVDCNNAGSPRYSKAVETSHILNETYDQKYDPENGKTWGYVEDLGKHSSSSVNDSYDSGWYAYNNQAIQYAFPLKAGTYSIRLGFKEWWKDSTSSRKMDIYMKQGDTETKLGSSNTWNGGNNWNTFTGRATVSGDSDSILVIRKQSGQPDPTLAFIEISKVLDTDALQDAVNAIKGLDLSKASAADIKVLGDLHQSALDALRNPETTQKGVDDLTKSLTDKIQDITNPAKTWTEQEIQANDGILYVFNAGTTDPSVTPSNIKRGLYQSSVSQKLKTDTLTGHKWGLEEDGVHSISAAGGNSTSLEDSYLYTSDSIDYVSGESGFKFSFELPERVNDDYTVTLGFKNPWDTRPVDVVLEDQTVKSGLTLTKGQLVEQTWDVTVNDGELNVFVHNPNRTSQYADPLISYVIVKATPEWTSETLSALLAKQAEDMTDRTFGKDSLDAYNAQKAEAQALITKEGATQEELRDMYRAMEKAYDSLKETFTYTSFGGDSNRAWVDNNGNYIQAHGGQVQKLKIDGQEKWAWYGEDRASGYTPMAGVHLYTSDDLYNWTDEGVVLRTVPVSSEDYGKDQNEGYKADYSIFETDPYFSALYGDCGDQEPDDPQYENKAEETYWNLANDRSVMERPKVIYNEDTGKYVMWFHSDGRTPSSGGSYGRARAGIAVSDSATGPFKLVSTVRLYAAEHVSDHGSDGTGGAVRDMNLFQDEDGTAYVIYSSDMNATMYIARLNDAYTGLAKDRTGGVDGTGLSAEEVAATDYTRNFINSSREAPAMFKYDGKYYLMTSGCTGWDPNQAQYAMADHPLGPWTVVGDPCVNDTSKTTFHTQSTCFIPVDPENGKFIYMGDRWTRSSLGTSGYVWLPVEIGKDGKMSIRSATNWTLEDLKASAKLSFTALDAQIQIAQAKNEADYTPASWAAFKAVLDEVVAGRDALSTQTDINAAKARLEQAIEGLVAKSSLNVDALSTAIVSADKLIRSDYIGATDWDAFDETLASARTALENKNSQDEIDAAAKALNDAMDALVTKASLNTTALSAAIDRAEKLDRDSYVDTTDWAALDQKVNAAKKALSDKNSQADLDAAAKTLNDALNALEKKAVLDYTLIDQILAKANALRTADFGKAGQDTIAALKAKALETKDAADDQAKLDASCITLNRALLALRKTPSPANLPK